MAGNQTLAIIKPDAVAAGKLGAILAHLEREGYRIRAARLVRLTRAQAEAFYEVHRGRPFYDGLVEVMSSGPCFPMVLERENPGAAFRASIGARDAGEAARGTIRKLDAESKGWNAVHGSDSGENAAREAGFFFSASERVELK